MLDLERHPFFKPYVDPKTGIKSFFLTEKVAELQQHFYFCNTSLSSDGKYLWIRCLNPPAQFIHLAVVSMDPDDPFIRSFPGAGSSGNLPGLWKDKALFGVENSVYSIDIEGKIEKLITLDNEFLKNRRVNSMFTHASVSCDGRTIALDMQIGGNTYIAAGDLLTGEVKHLNNFGRLYNHAMFSPVDPELMIIDQDWWRDYHSGEYFCIDNRIWLMDTNRTRFEPLIQRSWYGRDGHEIAHDFWAKDGTVCWADYPNGAYECDIETRDVVHVWRRPVCHCHTTSDRKFWVADQTPYAWKERPCQVLFYDRETNKEIEIFSALPNPKVERGGCYHLDPHPAFTDDDKYIISTVSLLDGSADVAITPVEPIIDLCREKGRLVD